MAVLMIKYLPLANSHSADCLTNAEMVATYLNHAFTQGELPAFLAALNTIVKTRRINQIAQETGVSRERLYKILSGSQKPHFEIIMKITTALGLTLSFSVKET